MDLFEILQQLGWKYLICKSLYIRCVGVLIVVSLHCEADVLSVCGLKLFVSKKISVEDLGDKNSVGLPCQPVQRGAHAAPLALLFVLVFPTLCEEKNLPRRGAIGEEHKTESQAAQSQLHHCRKCISQAAPPGSERELMSCESCAQKQPLFTSVTRSESCLCDDLNFCLHVEPQTGMLRLFNCWWKFWNTCCI